MNCSALGNVKLSKNDKKIVLTGNPNVGKSVLFNLLTGIYAEVSNFPGTTVDLSYGRFGDALIVDTPGVYGISSFNDEERVARDVILSADVIINVVDAVHLERDLFLTMQVIQTGIPTLVVLNMMDDVKAQGIKIHVTALEEKLGVPIIPAVAIKGEGISQIKASLYQARIGNEIPEIQAEVEPFITHKCTKAEALLIAEGDLHIARNHRVKPGEKRESIYQARRQAVDQLVQEVVRYAKHEMRFSVKVGRAMLRPLSGSLILIFVLVIMYYMIGVFVAQDVAEITEERMMRGVYEPFIRNVVCDFISEESVVGKYLIGEFGILTMTVSYVFGLLLPLVLGFYFVLSVMEDSGYLPRLATLLDRMMHAVGLNGRAVIPMILGFGCVTMATISTRLLGSQRERTIAVSLLGLTIPCSAQLGVITGLLAGLGIQYVALYVGVMLFVLGIVGKMLHQLLPGKTTDLFIDLPPIRLPRFRNVLTKMIGKSYAFIKEAAPIFALGALFITTLQVTDLLDVIQNWLAPLTMGILKLPRETANVFIMGLIRRDFGAAGISHMPLNPGQLIVALITITLFVPCIASVIVMFKERGKFEGLMIWMGSWLIAFIIGGIVACLVI
ncbi:ferrous iron transport protein B [Anaerosinus massiliensis]|uniref:ferrous iron transport protein B n=1 Tax=Massilibacillus massiliensis TaxID=1806837 RepID=UPI000A979E56|nr:ferrous iron transport protein B [Massilibacillus massiliensis]